MSNKTFGRYCGQHVNETLSSVILAGGRNPVFMSKALRGELIDVYVPISVERGTFKVEKLKQEFTEVSG